MSTVEKQYLERVISEPHKQWLAMLDAIGDYIFITDEEGKVIRTNKALATAFGKHPREVVGTYFHDLFNVDLPVAESAKDLRPLAAIERTIGDETYLISSFPLHGGDKPRTVHVMKNITEMERVREQLFHSSKLASLGLLVSGVAHEINNPLTGIISYTEMLRKRTKDEETEADLGKILESAHRCKRIVENLLAFSRQRTPAKTLESVNDIIVRTVELRSFSLSAHSIEVVKDLGEVPSVFVDAQQIRQVILNIIINAEQAVAGSRSGDGKITVSTRCDRQAGKVIVTVSDNGPGIPRDIMSRIFDPFFTTKPVGMGTGLGLSISYGIVEEHGWDIRVESTEGTGATFIIGIPLDQGGGTAVSVPGPAAKLAEG